MKPASSLAHDIAQMIRPGIKIPVSDATSKYIRVKGKGGGVDNWSAQLTPYMIEPMNCMASREYEAVIFVGPAQSGKTQALLFGSLAHDIKCTKSDVMIVQTTKQTATDWERADLSWTIRNSPELKSEMAAGSRADNVFVKTMRSGQNIFVAWPTVSNLSGKALRSVKLTDYDRMDAIPGEGSVFELARKRTTTFLSQGMTLAESSPSGKITDPQWRPSADSPHEAPPSESQILSLFNDGDRRRWYVQCPECGEYYLPPSDETGLNFPVNQDLFGVTEGKLIRQALYICTVNGCLIETSHKRAMNASGKWLKEGQRIEKGATVGEGRKSKIASFWFPGIFAAYADPQRLAERFLQGLRKYDLDSEEDTIRAVMNIDFGAPYRSRKTIGEYTGAEYQKRAETVPEKQVPDGVRFLVAACDVQGWGFSVAIIGYGQHRERWLIDRFELRVSDRIESGELQTMRPSVHHDDWLKLRDSVMQRQYPLADNSGRSMKIMMTACDSGGEPGVTDRAYAFWKLLRKEKLNDRFMLVKGEAPKPGVNKPTARKVYPDNSSEKRRTASARGEIPVWIVNTTKLKDALSADLKKEQRAPGYIHFPQWLPDAVYDELSAEQYDAKDGWVKISKRNELWDQFVYGEAAVFAKLQESKIKELNWNNQPAWAKPWDENPMVVGAKTTEINIQKHDSAPKPNQAKSKPDWIPKQESWL